MNKKLTILPILFFFVFSSVLIAQEEKPIENLAWATTGSAFIEVDIGNPDSVEPDYDYYEVEPFLTFHVPSSKKSDLIFFDVIAKVWFEYTSNQERHAHCRIYWKFLSDVIPDDMEAFFGWGAFVNKETNNSGNTSKPASSQNTYMKIPLQKNALDNILFQYKSGGWVPDEIALPIFNEMLETGFDLEVWASFELRGVQRFRLRPVSIHVTQLSK